MILEAAPLQVSPGQSDAFEAAFRQAQAIIASMPGYRSHELQRCLERQGHYLLLVRWESVSAHEEGFRGSLEYQEWKRLLHHFYDPFPTVLHYERAAPRSRSEEASIAEAEACLDAFTERFNARDAAGMDAQLHFPHVIVSGGGITIWQAPGQLPADFFERLSASGWHHSAYSSREPVLATSDKVHFRLRYTRRAADGAVLGEFDNVWIVTRVGGRWGIALRSY